jgi:hypothetical protein
VPIYEYYSPQARKIYSFYARSISYSNAIPRCPDNPAYRMEKMLSTFAVPGSKKTESSERSPEGAPDDARLEGVMAQMEKEFGGMDESNPDPRQLARLMRTVSDATGEKMPKEMQEMLARMEKGEDPERLEAEYGDVLENAEGAMGGDEHDEPGRAAKPRRRLTVTRDPKLYEMTDYLP